jgi:copper chaperone CopZ
MVRTAAKAPEERGGSVPDVVVWVTKPSDVDVPELETLGGEIRRLDHVSEVGFMTEQSALRVSFEGDKAKQEEIEDAIRQAGYEIFKVSS